MSRIWTAEDTAATPLGGFGSFGSLGRQAPGAFRSLYGEEEPGRAWQPGGLGAREDAVPPPPPPPAAPAVDPIEEAAREAFLQGFQEGDRLAREAAEADNAARAQLAEAVRLIAQSGEGTLAAMLSQAVVRLVGQIVGEVAIDEAVLKARCAAVAACIDGEESHAVLEVNPEDMTLLEDAATGIALAPNPALPRGTVRLATAEGWIEDGPDVRLARLKALLDDMEGRR